MICPKCSNNVDDRYRLCDRCGAEMPPLTSKQEAGAQQEAPQYAQPQYAQPPQYTQPPYYGYSQQTPPPQYGYGAPYGYPPSVEEDKPDTALNVLSFFIPILGLVLYFVEKDKKPIKAKAALKWAIASWIASAVFLVIYFIFVFGFAFFMGMGEFYY